ncbi:MAG: hypothetical protein CO118_08495 [Flavobacteriales bacterium CG_4_9_14_3_um_filter_32_8]|nr:MAG: hypothetical protein CO118_08495 [Flavobacteriales bacterium CG_4_9_14_3_um_filter_32_8]
MKKYLLLLLIIFNIFSIAVFGQDDVKKTGKIEYKYKMQDARHQFLTNGNVRESLNIYRELLKDYTNDAMVNYRIGECHYRLDNFDLAVEYFQNAQRINDKVDKDLYFSLAQAYHRNNQLDESLEAYNKYNSIASQKDRKFHQITNRISQLDYAKKMMASPVKAKIENLGNAINSRGGDYAPSISADGRTMIFTSRRSDTKGGEVDKAGDFKYFEDIYISIWDSIDNSWGKARPIEGNLNTEGHDACLSISPDGNSIYIYRNDGGAYIGDIFVSKKSLSSGSWGLPVPLEKPINTSYFESSACLSADGNKLYFVSEREGKKSDAQGKGDIYVSERLTRTTWSEPKNLGPIINTPDDEISVFIHPDGKTLFFSSKGHLSIGGLDIFMSKLQDDGSWSKPENLGYPINTIDDDVHFILSLDGKTAYYSAVKGEGLGERDIYKIDLSEYPILADGVTTNLSILKGVITNGENKVEANIEFKNETGAIAGKTVSNESGNYFITLAGGHTYSITINASGYQPLAEKVELPLGKGTTFIKENSFDLVQLPAPEK